MKDSLDSCIANKCYSKNEMMHTREPQVRHVVEKRGKPHQVGHQT